MPLMRGSARVGRVASATGEHQYGAARDQTETRCDDAADRDAGRRQVAATTAGRGRRARVAARTRARATAVAVSITAATTTAATGRRRRGRSLGACARMGQYERTVRRLPGHLGNARLQPPAVRGDDVPLEGPVVAGERAVALALEHISCVIARVVPTDGDVDKVSGVVVRTATGPVEHPDVLGRAVRDARAVGRALFVEASVAGEDVLTGLTGQQGWRGVGPRDGGNQKDSGRPGRNRGSELREPSQRHANPPEVVQARCRVTDSTAPHFGSTLRI